MADIRDSAGVVFRFGSFEANLETSELSRRGQRVRIQELPFRVLVALLREPGKVVSRESLAKELWPDNTFVEFDQGLSTAVTKLRQALGDEADNPRFIETVPRRGYRFIVPVAVECTEQAERPVSPPATEAAPAPGRDAPPAKRAVWKWVAGISFLLLVALAAVLIRQLFRGGTHLQKNDKVVLADFDNTTGNTAFDDTLNSALRVKLEESPFVRLVPRKALLLALSQLGRDTGGHVSQNGAQAVCRALQARAIVHGSVSSLGGSFRVRLEADSCSTGKILAREEETASSPDLVLGVLGSAADNLRRQLGEPESSVQRFGTPMTQATTSSLSALRAFAAGEEKRARGQDFETIGDYKLASDLDPEFALAYARLGTIYYNAQEIELSRTAYQKAFALRGRATEHERLYLTTHYYSSATGNLEKAAEVYNLWRQLYPEDLIAPNNLADIDETLGRLDESLAMAREAVRIDPNNAFPYGVLLQATQRLGRYNETRELWREASARNLNNSVLGRKVMFQVGIAQNDDALVKEQVDWASGNPRESELLLDMGWAKAASGQLRSAQVFFHKAQENARKNDLKEFAADIGEDLAQFESDIGETQQARAEVEHSLKLAPDDLNVSAFASLILADSGDLARAEALAQKVRTGAPENTIFVKMVLPMEESLISLRHADPAKAVEELKPVAPYDLSRATVLASIFYRAQALLAAKRGQDAIAEFQRIQQWRATRPTTHYLALAHLGMARSMRLTGDRKGSTSEYAAFLSLWKNADPDIPVLRKARAEYQAVAVSPQ